MTFPQKTLISATCTVALSVAGLSVATFSVATDSASANPCSTYKPTLGDVLEANGSSVPGSSATGSIPGADVLGSSSAWGDGKPVGLPSVTGNTEAIHMLTGPDGPDRLNDMGLASTDLGIMWDAQDGRVLAAFGDSFSCSGPGNGWHSNALFQTDDRDPSNGIYITGSANGDRSAEFLRSSLKVPGVEHTIIPTAGIAVDGVQYVDYMSVKQWGSPGQWTTNYAETAQSTDGGQSWTPVPGTMRTNSKASTDPRLPAMPSFARGNENFQMTAFASAPEGVSGSGYVYVYGTPNGRSGQGRVARIAHKDFPRFDRAEYWDGHGWGREIASAAPVLDGRVSELSVQYNQHLGAWLAVYEDPSGIVIRKSDAPEGPWSSPVTLISRVQAPDIYGGYMYPFQVDDNLYWVATTWQSYNAAVYRTDLDKVFGR